MHAIQAFLMKGLPISILATVLIIPGSILGQEVTISDKEWRVKERIRDGTIYDRDWRVKGYIENGRVYGRDWIHNLGRKFSVVIPAFSNLLFRDPPKSYYIKTISASEHPLEWISFLASQMQY